MPITKPAKIFRRRVGRLLFAAAGAWLVVATVIGFTVDDVQVRGFSLVASGIVALAVLALAELKASTEFICPDCGGGVAPPLETKGDGQPILRLCPKCDVLWHMGNTPTAD